MAEAGGEKPRKRWTLWAVIVALATISGALAVPQAAENFVNWAKARVGAIGAVELGATFPGEVWKPAAREDYAWLVDTWCYPTLAGFTSEFRFGGPALQRRNAAPRPRAFQSEWVDVEVFRSNRGMLRLRHANDWPGNYIDYSPAKTAEFHENERYVYDDGRVEAGDERLALSCARCTLSGDGLTYSCD